MAFEFNAAPTVSLFGIVDPRLAGQAAVRLGPPPVVDAEIVDSAQSAADRSRSAAAEVRLLRRGSLDPQQPILKGPISYGADGRPRYILQATPGAILSILA
jgi:hypothetical protein